MHDGGHMWRHGVNEFLKLFVKLALRWPILWQYLRLVLHLIKEHPRKPLINVLPVCLVPFEQLVADCRESPMIRMKSESLSGGRGQVCLSKVPLSKLVEKIEHGLPH